MSIAIRLMRQLLRTPTPPSSDKTTLDEALSDLRWMLLKLHPHDSTMKNRFHLNSGSASLRAENKQKLKMVSDSVLLLSERQRRVLESWVSLRAEKQKPLQYILGTLPFAGLDLIVRPPTLIPRWETEEWAMRVVDTIKSHMTRHPPSMNEPIHILDLCTGSGCIALALANHIPAAHILAIDNAPSAIKLARLNARRNALSHRVSVAQLDFMRGSIAEAVSAIESVFKVSYPAPLHGPSTKFFHYIVSNPPYVPQCEYEQLDRSVLDWEDKAALVGTDADALGFYRRISLLSEKLLSSNSPAAKNVLFKEQERVFLEIGGTDQVDGVQRALLDAEFISVQVWKDLAANDRVIVGLKKGTD
ncbi:S-adenosyl-L-methionine-dependent methyltransferase [Chytriomyces sp. MP71]|nr:S-adenosyl-L-methionine-dependent methyltransferase [Chytriomyces sp. MP71]